MRQVTKKVTNFETAAGASRRIDLSLVGCRKAVGRKLLIHGGGNGLRKLLANCTDKSILTYLVQPRSHLATVSKCSSS